MVDFASHNADPERMFRICSLFVLITLGTPLAADIVGPVRVIDGDTIAIGDTRIRIHGVDAPESAQTCDWQRVRKFNCGAYVTEQVRRHFGTRIARCEPTGVSYDRVVARCSVDGVDIGQWLVAEGLAVAYRKYSLDYVPSEERAIKSARGLRSFAFARPEGYRRARRSGRVTNASVRAPEGCAIKGNVSHSSGARIYHLPGQRDYARTVISRANGERWFCSETDARAAGWRKARR